MFRLSVYIMYWLPELPVVESPTYNSPCEKKKEEKKSPIVNQYQCVCLNIWPHALLIVMAKEFYRNSSFLNWKSKSVEIIVMWGMRAISPAIGPVKIVASIIWLHMLLICTLVPLYKLGGLRFRSKIMETPSGDY